MFDTELRDFYEGRAQQLTIALYKQLGIQYSINICDFSIPTDEYSPYDISAYIRGEECYIENKTRSDTWHWDNKHLQSNGYYLASAKNDGTNSIFNYWFPQDKVVMITNDKQLEGLESKKTWVKHIKQCDPESPSGWVNNYVVPLSNWWVYDWSGDSVKCIRRPEIIKK